MPRPSGKATISLKGNAKNLPDIYFHEGAVKSYAQIRLQALA